MLYPKSTCIVTGGSNGIGKELCLRLVSAGHDVYVIDIQEPQFDCAGYQYINLATWCPQIGMNHLFDKLKNVPSLLVNCAGVGQQANVSDVDTRSIDNITKINYTTPMVFNHMITYGLKHHRMHGHIVNVSSGQVFFQLPTWGVYTASKAALAAASETMHYELLRDNIFVTTVYPFMVNTGFYDEVKAQEGSWGSRMSMKLLPYYSYTPGYVAKQIYRAIESHKRVEMCSPINYLPKLLPMGIVRRLAAKVLMK